MFRTKLWFAVVILRFEQVSNASLADCTNLLQGSQRSVYISTPVGTHVLYQLTLTPSDIKNQAEFTQQDQTTQAEQPTASGTQSLCLSEVCTVSLRAFQRPCNAKS